MVFLNLLFFLISAFTLGWFILQPVDKYIGSITKFIGSFLTGLVFLALLTFFSAYFLGFSQKQIIVVTFLTDLPLIFWSLWKRKKKIRKHQVTKINISIKKHFKKHWLVYLIFLFLFFHFVRLWFRMLVFEDGNLFAGWISIWGDWAAHLSYISSFALGDNFPPQMPVLAGYPLSYTFLADFISAILVKLGLNIFQAALIPSFLFCFCFCLIFFDCARLVLKNNNQGLAALLIFLFNGGLGFWYFFQDVFQDGLWQTLIHLPREYTHLEAAANIQFINHITSEFVPQRAFILALPLTTLALFLLWQYSLKRKIKLLFPIVLIAILLPLVHLHSFFVLAIVSLFVFFITVEKKTFKIWLELGVLVLVLTLPQLLIFFPQTKSFEVLQFHPGWMAHKMNDNIFWFWFKNIGLAIFLIPLGFMVAPRKLKIASLPFFFIFILANLFLFQPFEYDNTKLFTYWYLQNSLLMVISLFLIRKQKWVGRFFAWVFFILLVLSGFLDVIRQSQYQHQKIYFLSREEIAAATWVQVHTPPQAVFLTADSHDHPIPMLAGRKILLGFRGWLWTYNIDYLQRETDLNLLVSQPSLSKLKQLGVNYVYFSAKERGSFIKTLEPWVENHLTKVYQGKTITIYQYPL